jgi:phage repressor protein C with HTH and peptisase S24 domain
MRKEIGLTQQQLADRIGVTKGTISAIENAKWGASTDTLQKLADVFGCSLDDLFSEYPEDASVGGKLPARRAVKQRTALDPARYVFVRKYDDVRGGLGSGKFNEDHVEVSGTHAYRLDMILAKGWRPEALVVIRAEGDSMTPTVNDGDVVLVNTDETAIVSGLLYAIEDPDNGVRIKRLRKMLDGRVRVESDNPDKRMHPDDYLTPDSRARVIGRAVDRSGAL